jgi:hypothetical protein
MCAVIHTTWIGLREALSDAHAVSTPTCACQQATIPQHFNIVLFETADVEWGHFAFQRVGVNRLRLGEHVGSETHGDRLPKRILIFPVKMRKFFGRNKPAVRCAEQRETD